MTTCRAQWSIVARDVGSLLMRPIGMVAEFVTALPRSVLADDKADPRYRITNPNHIRWIVNAVSGCSILITAALMVNAGWTWERLTGGGAVRGVLWMAIGAFGFLLSTALIQVSATLFTILGRDLYLRTAEYRRSVARRAASAGRKGKR